MTFGIRDWNKNGRIDSYDYGLQMGVYRMNDEWVEQDKKIAKMRMHDTMVDNLTEAIRSYDGETVDDDAFDEICAELGYERDDFSGEDIEEINRRLG